MLLFGAMYESQHTDNSLLVLSAADRWNTTRERLLRAAESLDESSEEAVEALCFLVDESLVESYKSGSLNSYSVCMREAPDILSSYQATPVTQSFVLTELEKLSL